MLSNQENKARVARAGSALKGRWWPREDAAGPVQRAQGAPSLSAASEQLSGCRVWADCNGVSDARR